MKTISLKQLLLGCAAILCAMTPALAAVPTTINYQGQLTDSGGAPVNGSVSIVFALYTVASGGSPVWTETQPAVAVNQGVFNVELGSVTALDPNDFNVLLYLGIKVGADPEMAPRTALSSTGYALRSETTEAVAAGGVDSAALAADAVTSAKIAAGAVGNTDLAGNAVSTTKIQDNAVTAAKIVDGAGSTLDADLLDGLQASEIIAAAGGEVRTAISTLPYTIASAGSYYLTGDLTATGATGITVNANHVTIDLMGFSVIGNGTAYYGIYMSARDNVEIRNGTVRGFGQAGIFEVSSTAKNHRVINVRALGNGALGTTDAYSGIYLSGNNHRVQDSTAADNGGYGIYVGSGSTVTGNTVYNNQGAYGIFAYYGATVTGNTAYYNQGTYGIYAYSGSTMTGNTVYNNQGSGIYTLYGGTTVNGNTVYKNKKWGIYTGSGSTVKDNTVSSNNQSNTAGEGGIRVNTDSQVKGNTLVGNLRNNIYVSSSDNIIEENLVTDSTNGINFNAAGNFYANNRASGNTTNYAGTLPTSSGDGGGNVGF